jgi:hypothetical protein
MVDMDFYLNKIKEEITRIVKAIENQNEVLEKIYKEIARTNRVI